MIDDPGKHGAALAADEEASEPEDALKLAQNAAEKAVPVIQKHLVEAKKITASLKG